MNPLDLGLLVHVKICISGAENTLHQTFVKSFSDNAVGIGCTAVLGLCTCALHYSFTWFLSSKKKIVKKYLFLL